MSPCESGTPSPIHSTSFLDAADSRLQRAGRIGRRLGPRRFEVGFQLAEGHLLALVLDEQIQLFLVRKLRDGAQRERVDDPGLRLHLPVLVQVAGEELRLLARFAQTLLRPR